jgi:hypothetical protein
VSPPASAARAHDASGTHHSHDAQERGAQRRPGGCEHGADQERGVVAARERDESSYGAALDRLSPSRGDGEQASRVVTLEDVRSLAITLPRTSEAFVRGRVKFRIGRIVYLAFSRDETVMGFAFPTEWRDALVAAQPDKFMLPSRSDLRYNWTLVRLAAIDADEMRELVLDAWAMVVPKRVAAAYGDELDRTAR